MRPDRPLNTHKHPHPPPHTQKQSTKHTLNVIASACSSVCASVSAPIAFGPLMWRRFRPPPPINVFEYDLVTLFHIYPVIWQPPARKCLLIFGRTETMRRRGAAATAHCEPRPRVENGWRRGWTNAMHYRMRSADTAFRIEARDIADKNQNVVEMLG